MTIQKNYGSTSCQDCGTGFDKTGPTQVRCPPCKVQARRQKDRENRQSPEGQARLKKYRQDNLDRIRKRDRDWYEDNKESRKKSIATNRAKSVKKKMDFLRNLKSNPCIDCGNAYPTECMDFDHVPERGMKRFEISNIVKTCGMTKLLEELQKCDLVCANCHRIRTTSRLKQGSLVQK